MEVGGHAEVQPAAEGFAGFNAVGTTSLDVVVNAILKITTKFIQCLTFVEDESFGQSLYFAKEAVVFLAILNGTIPFVFQVIHKY